MHAPSEPASVVRLDQWLWAARCFKTRSLAAQACTAGHVQVNGIASKPAKPVRVGDRIEVRTLVGLRVLEIVHLAQRRGPAPAARALYLDHTPPPPPEEPGSLARPERPRGAGRPSKKEQRQIQRLRGY